MRNSKVLRSWKYIPRPINWIYYNFGRYFGQGGPRILHGESLTEKLKECYDRRGYYCKI